MPTYTSNVNEFRVQTRVINFLAFQIDCILGASSNFEFRDINTPYLSRYSLKKLD